MGGGLVIVLLMVILVVCCFVTYYLHRKLQNLSETQVILYISAYIQAIEAILS